jgi:glycerol-3-phosphate acyltransferase PlsY
VSTEILIVFISSYVLGSIPFGLILTKIFIKKDIRKIGSKNIGATNVLRTGNKSIAILTLLLDILKGGTAVLITEIYFPNLIFLSGLAAFLGHIFPVWLKFNGGKGVATYLGILLIFSLKLGLIFCLSWVLIAFITKYSSLSSIISSLIIFIISFTEINFELNSYLFITFVIILYTHRQNIIRLKNKVEDKIKL